MTKSLRALAPSVTVAHESDIAAIIVKLYELPSSSSSSRLISTASGESKTPVRAAIARELLSDCLDILRTILRRSIASVKTILIFVLSRVFTVFILNSVFPDEAVFRTSPVVVSAAERYVTNQNHKSMLRTHERIRSINLINKKNRYTLYIDNKKML